MNKSGLTHEDVRMLRMALSLLDGDDAKDAICDALDDIAIRIAALLPPHGERDTERNTINEIAGKTQNEHTT
jgi:hypothetical protein